MTLKEELSQQIKTAKREIRYTKNYKNVGITSAMIEDYKKKVNQYLDEKSPKNHKKLQFDFISWCNEFLDEYIEKMKF